MGPVTSVEDDGNVIKLAWQEFSQTLIWPSGRTSETLLCGLGLAVSPRPRRAGDLGQTRSARRHAGPPAAVRAVDAALGGEGLACSSLKTHVSPGLTETALGGSHSWSRLGRPGPGGLQFPVSGAGSPNKWAFMRSLVHKECKEIVQSPCRRGG